MSEKLAMEPCHFIPAAVTLGMFDLMVVVVDFQAR